MDDRSDERLARLLEAGFRCQRCGAANYLPHPRTGELVELSWWRGRLRCGPCRPKTTHRKETV